MLNVLYGFRVNSTGNSASNKARVPFDPNTVYPAGTWVSIEDADGTAKITGSTAAEGFGAEIVWQPHNRAFGDGLPTLDGMIEALTDQYVGPIASKARLVVKNGKLVAANADKSEDAFLMAIALGDAPAGGTLRFKTI